MFTVEHEDSFSRIVVMDETSEREDVILEFHEDELIISQVDSYDDAEIEVDNIISISYPMLDEIIAAYNSPEGLYSIKK